MNFIKTTMIVVFNHISATLHFDDDSDFELELRREAFETVIKPQEFILFRRYDTPCEQRDWNRILRSGMF